MELRGPSARRAKRSFSPDNTNHDNKRNNSRDAQRKKLKAEKNMTREKQRAEHERIRSDNLIKYNSMSLPAKIRFACAGYCFRNNPSEPAVELSTTTMKTAEGMNRCVIAGPALPELPIGFIILYSHYEISEEESTDIQRRYQVSLHTKKIMKIHTEPATKYGLANFINCAQNENRGKKKKKMTSSEQNMCLANCELVRSQQGLNKRMRKKYPAYVKVTKPIAPGDELLMHYGNSYRMLATE